jgi:hypothetical protein
MRFPFDESKLHSKHFFKCFLADIKRIFHLRTKKNQRHYIRKSIKPFKENILIPLKKILLLPIIGSLNAFHLFNNEKYGFGNLSDKRIFRNVPILL